MAGVSTINNILTAEKFSGELDKVFVQKSVTSMFRDNNLRSKFVGAKTVIIPDIDFAGLVDYDKDNGFARGAMTVHHTPYTLDMDRARSIQIDREDMDETGVANLAGQILGEYVRTKVVPESDAYVLSRLFNHSLLKGNVSQYTSGKEYAKITELFNKVYKKVGYDEELVAFVEGDYYAALESSAEVSRHIMISDFKKGDVNLKVKSINGVPLIPVVPNRMMSAYTFASEGEGGFAATDSAVQVKIIVLPKSAAKLIIKSEKLRTFSPEENQQADAYKFDYRIYYDVIVKKSMQDTIFAASVSVPELEGNSDDAEESGT